VRARQIVSLRNNAMLRLLIHGTVLVFMVVLQLGGVVVVAFESHTLLLLPHSAYTLFLLPQCATRPYSCWRGVVHTLALGYVLALPFVAWLLASVLCTEPLMGNDSTEARIRQNDMKRSATQYAYVAALYAWTTAARLFMGYRLELMARQDGAMRAFIESSEQHTPRA